MVDDRSVCDVAAERGCTSMGEFVNLYTRDYIVNFQLSFVYDLPLYSLR